MSACDQYGMQMPGYLDGQLQGEDLADFRAHLNDCLSCRADLEQEQALSRLLHGSRPLYSAPTALRAQVAAASERSADPREVTGGLLRSVSGTSGEPFAKRGISVPSLGIIAASLAIVAILLGFVPTFERNVRAANYVDTAIAEHRSYVDGSRSPELRSNSPAEVSAWFDGKVPFPLQLAGMQIAPNDHVAYRLTGGSVVKYKGKLAALVTYQKQNEKVSLMVASADSAVVAGGREERSGRLTFHYRNTQGFNVATWTDHGVSYALVSSGSSSNRGACMVCHQSMADQNSFNPPSK
jgi:anti-sigma factor RsiW